MGNRVILGVAAVLCFAPAAQADAERRVAPDVQVKRTAAWMRTLGIPVPAVRLRLLPATYGSDTVLASSTMIVAPRFIGDAWAEGEFGDVLIHELAHTASPHLATWENDTDRTIEEGAATAVADDLFPAWRHRFSSDGIAFGDPLDDAARNYHRAGAWVRRVSLIATGGGELAARHWRRKFVYGDRSGMLASAAARYGRPLPAVPVWR